MTGIRWAFALSISCGAGAAALLLAAPTALAQPQANQGVNGGNVIQVLVANARYQQQANGRWAEFDRNGRVAFTFDEVGRDEWSVYLDDPSRNVQLQLDLFRRMVTYGTNGSAKSDLYAIIGSSRAAPAIRHQPAAPSGRMVNAGPIWNQQDAEVKCPVVAYAVGGRWTGQWRTTRQGQMSVCEIGN